MQFPEVKEFFVIADTHFNHANIIRYTSRPFNNVEEMNQYMIVQWNAAVADDDVIIHLGDVALGRKVDLPPFIQKLRGQKYLIMGNHDRRLTVTAWKKIGFIEVSKKPISVGQYILSHEPLRDVPDGFINVFGHVHNKSYDGPGICVSVEHVGYRPVKLTVANLRER